MSSLPPELVRRFEIKKIRNGVEERVLDWVASEEPLQIHLGYWFKERSATTPLAVTMRTPGHDRELTAGYLLTEGIIHCAGDILELRAIGAGQEGEIIAELARHVDLDERRIARNSFAGASCGICGKRTREAAVSQAAPLSANTLVFDRHLLTGLPQLVQNQQQGFARTGGLHAAALINRNGELESVFEDIGRHNALDKLIGHALLSGRLPLSESLVFLSSRSSFELIQKTAMAGCPVLATVGGPSSLAIEAARGLGLTLIGFLRDKRFNLYSGEWRLNL